MATKLPIAQKRMFTDIFVCKNCDHKVRTQAVRILAGKVKCRKCNGKTFRTIRKK